MEKKRRSREKHESFIGKTFNGGTLKVTGIIGSNKYGNKIYSVTCDICSQDKGLFPEGYFTSTKRQLEQGQIPCGCSKCPHYTKDQFFVLVKREGMLRNFTVESMDGEYKNTQTKLNLKCKIDNNEWITTISSILHKKSGCPECNSEKLRNKYKTSEEVAIEKCKQICEIMNYTFIRFTMGYKIQNHDLNMFVQNMEFKSLVIPISSIVITCVIVVGTILLPKNLKYQSL